MTILNGLDFINALGLIGWVVIISLAAAVWSTQIRNELREGDDLSSEEQECRDATEEERNDVSDDSKNKIASNGSKSIEVVGEAASDLSDKSKAGQTTSRRLKWGAAGTGVTAEFARQAGIDRHAEAGFVEDAAARGYVNKYGGEVVDTTSSVYAPDGGVDKIINTPEGKKTMQIKHYGSKIGDPVLERYNSEDIIAPTQGVRKNADLSRFESQVTRRDWLFIDKLRLELLRIKRGYCRGVRYFIRGARGVRHAITRLQSRLAGNHLTSVGKRLISKFTRQPSGRELLVFVLFGGSLWLIWKKWDGEYTYRDLGKWLAAVGVSVTLAATIDRLRK
jgi:hypothetical protein